MYFNASSVVLPTEVGEDAVCVFPGARRPRLSLLRGCRASRLTVRKRLIGTATRGYSPKYAEQEFCELRLYYNSPKVTLLLCPTGAPPK